MSRILCISIRFIQPFPLFHGRRDAEQPEWPPSPMRMYQALLNASSLRSRGRPLAPEVRQALQGLEVLRPEVIAPRATVSSIGYRAYVPHNQYDLVFAALHRGMEQSTEVFRKVNGSVRAEKDFRPMRVETLGDDLPTLHYLYPLDATTLDADGLLRAIRPSVRAITHLGWGIDQVVADATLIDRPTLQPSSERWLPSARAGRRLRVHQRLPRRADETPQPFPLIASKAAGHQFRRLKRTRISIRCVTAATLIRYRVPASSSESSAMMKQRFSYAQSKLIHVAGIVKHLAIEQMKRNPPRDLRELPKDQWIEQYVAGHRDKSDSTDAPHTQFSYIPLQSIGTDHTDPAVRRVMVVAPDR